MTASNNVAKVGFTIIPKLLQPSEVQQIVTVLSESPPKRSRAGARHILSHPAVAAVASGKGLLLLAQEILGPKAFPFRATLFDKSSAANWLVAWHQDTALPVRERHETAGWGPWSVKDGVHYAHAPASALEQVLALRLHLDDSNQENGPLRVLPATHTLGVLTDGQIRDLAINAPRVDCIVDAGGVLAMRPLVIHASSKSRSGRPRRVLHIEYAAHHKIGEDLRLAVDGSG